MAWFWRKRPDAGSEHGTNEHWPELPRPESALAPLRLEIPGPLPGDASAPRTTAPRRRTRWRWRFRLFFVWPLYAATALIGSIAAMLVYYTMVWPDPHSLRHRERAPVVRVLAHDGSVIAERGAAHDYTPLAFLPDHVRDAVLATEDHRFYDHFGVDPVGLVRAVFTNIRAGRFAQGGSTLTQQLAKNLFLTSERTLERKLEELLLAIWLEIRLSKDEILELYLNRVYFGSGAYGIEAAAQRYFDKPARELTVAEAALVAGLLKAPSRFSPVASPGAARTRARTVLKRMREAGSITEAQYQAAARESVRFANGRPSREQTGLEYAIDHVLDRLPQMMGSGHSEIIVETTLDAALQRRAQTLVGEAVAKDGGELGATQAAMVVLDTDGAIRALVGGRAWAESQFNRAIKARRQPGSAFKPILYLAALESGLSPATIAYDLPVSVQGWTPRNEGGNHVGAVTLRQALAQSINTVAVRLMLDLGPARVIASAKRLGISSELTAQPSLALGTSEVSLLELTGAYAPFANGGQAVKPHVLTRVRTGSGQVVFARQAPGRTTAAIAPQHVAAMNDMLSTAVASGTGRRAAIPPHPIAGKTGTTQDFRDAWFIGYSGHMIAGVWVGNDNGKPMNRVMGGNLPAQIWRLVMTAAHQGRPVRALPGVGHAGTSPPVAAVRSTGPLDGAEPAVGALGGHRSPTAATRSDSAPTPAKETGPREIRGDIRPLDDPIARLIVEKLPGDQPAAGAPPAAHEIASETLPPTIAPQRAPPPGMMSLGGGRTVPDRK